jgi:eukaryotic-like serine/threonine-protein kinase
MMQAPAPSEAPVKPGDILAQKYRVERVLGMGGMGVVVAATHIELDQLVAMKFMLDTAFGDENARKRFLREAQAARKLRSEHVAQVHDTGRLENGAPYIVLEYLQGSDLSTVLRNSGPLPIPFAAEVMVQACDALAEAFHQGIVHRDLKPANLFLTERTDGTPLVKVLDFGISKNNALSDGSMAMTKTSAMMGSPLYMSPEQMRSAKDVDHRTDIWSMGIILYEFLAGRVPFMSDSLGGLLYTVMHDTHPPLLSMTQRTDIPPEIVALVDWCLRKEPTERPANVADIARILGPFCPPRVHHTIERISAVMHAASASSTPGQPGPTTANDPSRPGVGGSRPSFHSAPGTVPTPAIPFGLSGPQGRPVVSASASGPQTGGSQAAPTNTHAMTSAGWSGTSPGGARSSAVPWVIGGIGAAVLVALVAVIAVLSMSHHEEAAATPPAPPAPTVAVSPAAPATGLVAPAATPPPVAAVEPMPPATASAGEIAPPPEAPPSETTPPAPAPSPRANGPAPQVVKARPGSAAGNVPPPAHPAARPTAPPPTTPKPALGIPDTSK